jgi:hypothetical protein
LWHCFTRASDGTIDFGKRVLFPPSTLPNSDSYIAWADTVPLLDSTVCLFGPFSFLDPASNPLGRTSSYRQSVPFSAWASLTTLCLSRGIIPPVLSSPPTTRSRWTRSTRTLPR